MVPWTKGPKRKRVQNPERVPLSGRNTEEKKDIKVEEGKEGIEARGNRG